VPWRIRPFVKIPKKEQKKGVEALIYIVEDLDMITKLESGDLNL
jgi:hypothetical protein